MTTFDRREEAFETLFAHDEEMQFKARARRAKSLAAWAGGLMHKVGAEADVYARAILAMTIADAGDQALFDRLRRDFDAAGTAMTDGELRAEMDRLLDESRDAVRRS